MAEAQRIILQAVSACKASCTPTALSEATLRLLGMPAWSLQASPGCRLVHSVLQSPRGDGKEALVLVTPGTQGGDGDRLYSDQAPASVASSSMLAGISVASGAAVCGPPAWATSIQAAARPFVLHGARIHLLSNHGDKAAIQFLRGSLCPGCRSQWPDSCNIVAAAPVHCAVAGQGHHLDHTGQHL